MPGLYSITTRSMNELIDATKYNSDHQNHVDNQTPQMTDDYSTNVAQMQTVSDPGEVGTESLPTSLAGELERLRFLIKEITGGAQWYTSPSASLGNLLIAGDTSAELAATNTALETGLFTLTITGNKIGSGGILHGSADVFVSSMLNAATLTIKFYWGGVAVFSPQIINLTGSTQTNFGVTTSFRLHNRNATNSQGLHFVSCLPANINNLLRFNLTGGGLINSTVVGASIDTTTNQLFQLNVQWGTADPSNSCFGLGIDAYRTK